MATPYFPPKTLETMRKTGVGESDVIDTINSGECFSASDGSYKMVKRYESSGYEVSLYYKPNGNTGQPVVTYAEKRPIKNKY